MFGAGSIAVTVILMGCTAISDQVGSGCTQQFETWMLTSSLTTVDIQSPDLGDVDYFELAGPDASITEPSCLFEGPGIPGDNSAGAHSFAAAWVEEVDTLLEIEEYLLAAADRQGFMVVSALDEPGRTSTNLLRFDEENRPTGQLILKLVTGERHLKDIGLDEPALIVEGVNRPQGQ